MAEKICKYCSHWIPNGGVLGYGYCCANQMGYRKPTQTCKTNFVERARNIRVKFAGKWYEVISFKVVAGCAHFAIEDEPNHFDWITNPTEVETKPDKEA